MQIFVVLLSGKDVTIECEATDNIEDIRRKIQDRTGIAIVQQRLVFAGLQLEDYHILSDLGVRDSM